MKKTISLLLISFFATLAYSSDYEYKFRLYLKDKGKHKYSVDRPEEFLSDKAIDRRERHSIAIEETDYPVANKYIDEIGKTGAVVVAKSKWNNTVAVHLADSSMIEKLQKLDFVTDTKLVWRGNVPKTFTPDSVEFYPMEAESMDSYYGAAYDNIKMLKGDTLHNRGFKGENMTIAVIDAGFNNFPKIEFLDNLNIIGHKSFVYNSSGLFNQSNQHGLNVISCIGTNKPHQFVGTAPHADFWMLGTEDHSSEYPIEEDYWAAAIEFADSVGVDVVNTSLGYTNYDFPAESYTWNSLDGKAAMISRSADMAAEKGMLIVVSAGNSGNKAWGKVSAPGDAHNVLTVGAIARDSIIAPFSSRGLTADLRLKPDVVALGLQSVAVNNRGKIAKVNGTSFSSPIMCGIAACLWQAFPTLTNIELLEVIRESGNRFDDPSSIYGFGIPDMEKAMELAQKAVDRKERLKKLK